jgi:exodeoxyribonuclease-3
MKVATWNVNGIRARVAQVLEWVAKEAPDVLCMQEIKASPEHVPAELSALEGYWGYWHGYKGYSGVALHLRKSAFPRKPKFEHPEFDHENRIVTARSHDALIASIYVPNGNKDYPAKVRFLEALAKWATGERATTERMILCGDLNVAREERDVHPTLRRPEQIGQTPAERALLEAVIATGFVDLSRKFRPDDDRLFTWWAPWRNLRQRNIGWRLDYVLARRRSPRAPPPARCIASSARAITVRCRRSSICRRLRSCRRRSPIRSRRSRSRFRSRRRPSRRPSLASFR